MSKIKVVIDTNLWVSALINVRVNLTSLIANPHIKIVISDSLIKELEAVLRRDKFRRYFSLEEAEVFLSILQEAALLVEVTSNVMLCDDPKDNFSLNLSIDSNADFLLTGDNDLLRMTAIQQTKIITLTHFFSILNTTNE